MTFEFEGRPSDSPFVEALWRTRSESEGSFTSLASTNFELVITRLYGKTTLTVRGPETVATPAPVPGDAEFFGITFKLGTFMPYLPGTMLVDNPVNLQEAASTSFWLQGAAWQFPAFENADTFVNRLFREGILANEPVVDAALQGQLRTSDLSLRSVQRRFLHATGLTYSAVRQIERARHAMALLEQGVSILDTVDLAGYADQPHLTRSLRRLVGRTPAQILGLRPLEDPARSYLAVAPPRDELIREGVLTR